MEALENDSAEQQQKVQSLEVEMVTSSFENPEKIIEKKQHHCEMSYGSLKFYTLKGFDVRSFSYVRG